MADSTTGNLTLPLNYFLLESEPCLADISSSSAVRLVCCCTNYGQIVITETDTNYWFVGDCVSLMDPVNGTEFCLRMLFNVLSLYTMLNYCQT